MTPTVLAFDTSGAYCAAALLRPDGRIVTRVEDMSRGQGERLMVLLEEVLQSENLSWCDLDGIGVGVGPGNFTGIRISVSAARGLALGLGVPAVGVSLFDTTQRLSNWAQVFVPAPRDQVYFMDFDKQVTPVMTTLDRVGTAVASTEHNTADHVTAMAQISAQRIAQCIASGATIPRPAPLYVKSPDAAPSRDTPPLILP